MFVNRRGFAPSLKCAACAWESRMPALRGAPRRASGARARCAATIAGTPSGSPRACPECGNVDLLPRRLRHAAARAALRAAFPRRGSRASTATRRAAKDAFARRARARRGPTTLDILVGTQMLAKGHDFPRLTLVGVLGADNALYSADFRATERLAALLMQVAGRAGRADCRRGDRADRFPGPPGVRRGRGPGGDGQDRSVTSIASGPGPPSGRGSSRSSPTRRGTGRRRRAGRTR